MIWGIFCTFEKFLTRARCVIFILRGSEVTHGSAVSSPSKVLYLAGGYDVDGYSPSTALEQDSIGAELLSSSIMTKQWSHKSTLGQV